MTLREYIEKHTLATFLTELTAKVEDLRKKHPDAIYIGVNGGCSYTEGHICTCGECIPSGCILGEGMKEMGIDVSNLNEQFNREMKDYFGEGFDHDIMCLTSIQMNQDSGIPWGNCLTS